MQKADSGLGRLRGLVVLPTVALVIVADQLTKAWVRSYPEGHVLFEAGFLRLVRVQNTGAAFGLFQGQSLALTVVAIVGMAVILYLVFVAQRHFPFASGAVGAVAFSLMLGGTGGNLIDRVRLGDVTDFVDVGIWPAFNVADSAVVVGAAVLAYLLIRFSFTERRGHAG